MLGSVRQDRRDLCLLTSLTQLTPQVSRIVGSFAGAHHRQCGLHRARSPLRLGHRQRLRLSTAVTRNGPVPPGRGEHLS